MKLLHGDCLELLPTLPDGSVDLVLTDPPYGTTACVWDAVIPFEPMWREVRRVLKPRGAAVFTASQPFTSALVMSNPREFAYEWVWVKSKITGVLNAKKMPVRQRIAAQSLDRVPRRMAKVQQLPLARLRFVRLDDARLIGHTLLDD